MPVSSKMDAYLLVEGENDFFVLETLCQEHNIPETFEIRHPKGSGLRAGGIEQLLENFHQHLISSAGDTKALGIVLDADDVPDKRWRQVTTIIQQVNFGYTVPEQPMPTGVIIPAPAEYHPRLGIWLMPDNQSLGELADFVSFLIPPDDELPPYAHHILNEIEKAKLNRYGKKRNKAFIHTWLAWQHEPGLPMGRAITVKALSAASPIALTFINWLNRLFNPHG